MLCPAHLGMCTKMTFRSLSIILLNGQLSINGALLYRVLIAAKAKAYIEQSTHIQ